MTSESSIRDALLRGDITWQDALELIKSLGKPWHRPGWQEMRVARLKDRCEQCGGCEDPLVLQHIWQPTKFNELRQHIRAPLWEQFKRDHLLVVSKVEPTDLPGCPKCNSAVIRHRKRLKPSWVCQGTKNGQRCSHKFDEPILVKALTADQRQEQFRLEREAYEARWQKFIQQHGEATNIETVLLSIDLNERYMSGEDTKTFCKKCAYMWDVNGCMLCKNCKKEYHAFYRNKCIKCDTENYALCKNCGERYHKRRYQTCYACFITERYGGAVLEFDDLPE